MKENDSIVFYSLRRKNASGKEFTILNSPKNVECNITNNFKVFLL